MTIIKLQEPTSKPSVDNQNHKSLEQEVKDYLEGNGFVTQSFTYHDHLPEDKKKLLQYRFTPTALYLRGRADRTAIHKIYRVEFEYEIKTHSNDGYDDLSLELLPLLHYLARLELDVSCLYIFRVKNTEGGFWTHRLPKIKSIWIPPRKEWEGLRAVLFHGCEVYLPDVRIVERSVGGSGDPFVLIDKSEIAKCEHWKTIINGLLPIAPGGEF